MIEIFNKFNRAFCKIHPERRLSTSHLKDHHCTELNYEMIEEAMRRNEWNKIKEYLDVLRKLENDEKENCLQDNEITEQKTSK